MSSPRLGVNIDHVATVRNARGGEHPDPFAAALLAVGAGADGITAHLREDRRHIRDADLERLAASPEMRLNMEMAATLAPRIRALRDAGIRVSLFLDPDPAQLRAARDLGAEVVELHTGAYAEGRPGEFERLRDAAALLDEIGLECHAGHGLTYANVRPVALLPQVEELNIGHFLIGQAITDGLPNVVATMKRMIARA